MTENTEINDYLVIDVNGSNALVMKVRELMAQGWQVIGGVSAVPGVSGVRLYQAMGRHTPIAEQTRQPSDFLRNED